MHMRPPGGAFLVALRRRGVFQDTLIAERKA